MGTTHRGKSLIPDLPTLGKWVSAVTLIVVTAFTLNGRWVLTKTYAGDIAAMQTRQLHFEERSIQKDIYDLEDRLANPRLPAERKAVYRERLRNLKMDMKQIEEEKNAIQKVK